jgi:hypothetical protein
MKLTLSFTLLFPFLLLLACEMETIDHGLIDEVQTLDTPDIASGTTFNDCPACYDEGKSACACDRDIPECVKYCPETIIFTYSDILLGGRDCPRISSCLPPYELSELQLTFPAYKPELTRSWFENNNNEIFAQGTIMEIIAGGFVTYTFELVESISISKELIIIIETNGLNEQGQFTEFTHTSNWFSADLIE